MMLFDMTFNLDTIKDVPGKIAASQEMTRSWLAKAAFAGGGILLLVSMFIPVFTDLKASDIAVYISPIIGLMGVVLGFYFGQKT